MPKNLKYACKKWCENDDVIKSISEKCKCYQEQKQGDKQRMYQK